VTIVETGHALSLPTQLLLSNYSV